jgi:hypothetical protein
MMTKKEKILKLILSSGAVYFFLVTIAHLFEIKIPGFFIYFDVQSFQYQNKIISLLAFGWSSYFYVSTKFINTNQIKNIIFPIIAGSYAIMIFSMINMSDELSSITSELYKYWIGTIALFLYLLLLTILWILVLKEAKNA